MNPNQFNSHVIYDLLNGSLFNYVFLVVCVCVYVYDRERGDLLLTDTFFKFL